MKNFKIIYKRLAKVMLVAALLIASSCSKDYLDPVVALDKDLATNINNVDDLTNIILGAYERAEQTGFFGRDLIVHGSVRSDDGYSNGNSGRFIQSAQFAYTPTSGDPGSVWNAGWQVITNCNVIINTVTEDDGTPEANQVRGEAFALRALAHMELLIFFGQQWAGGSLGIPYITEYLGDLLPSRLPAATVWTNIGNDFDTAFGLMSESLNEGPTRLTTFGVAALKSRYDLLVGDYADAKTMCEYVMTGSFSLATSANLAASYVGSSPSNDVFELAYTAADNPNINGLYQIMNYTGYGDVLPLPGLYNLYDAGDARRDLIEYDAALSTYRMAGKYPSSSYDDNIRVVRYSEVLLNYSEALLMTGDPANALIYLNMVPAAVGATTWPVANISNIMTERRKELAMEGFRFQDLMRQGLGIQLVDPVLQTFGADIPFGDYRLAMPIPSAEINANSNMVQNTGY